MRFSELSPEFVRIEAVPCSPEKRAPDCSTTSPHTEHEYRIRTGFAEADGVFFLCPACFRKNGGRAGTHGIYCWRPRVPIAPNREGPGRWEFRGTGAEDLTLDASPRSSSVLLQTAPCRAHFYVRGGEIVGCP